MKQTIRYIDRTFAIPFVDYEGRLCIEWCGEILPVIGMTTEGVWIVPKKAK